MAELQKKAGKYMVVEEVIQSNYKIDDQKRNQWDLKYCDYHKKQKLEVFTKVLMFLV
ncbi:hypothetical protein Scep_012594 [Stephania cephalantha]|uniref:Uncharacterized protein n=1 Tax=Stephania cephalantha TaxID=152367 RepID=A0AAP0JGR1_9MAGN